jgi:hypothetical protein
MALVWIPRVACKLLLIGAMTVVIFFDFSRGPRQHGYMTRSTMVDLPASVSSGKVARLTNSCESSS